MEPALFGGRTGDPSLLEDFVRVARAGSLTAAALAAGRGQSALSKRIAKLEASLGGRLFVRNGRGTVLTELGREALPLAEHLLQQLSDFSRIGSTHGTVATGEVRVGVVPSLAPVLVGRLFEAVSTRHPRVRLAISEAFTDVLVPALSQGELDVAVFNRYSKGELPSEVRLSSEDMCLIGPTTSRFSASADVPFASLAGLPLVLPNHRNELRRRLDLTARRLGFTLDNVLTIDSMQVMLEVVMRMKVYGMSTVRSVAPLIRAGSIRASRLVRPTLKRHVVLSVSPWRPPSPAARAVANLTRSILAEALQR